MSALPATVRNLIQSVAIGAALLSLTAHADEVSSVHRIGVLTAALPRSPVEEGLRDGLRELGYIEGKNIVIEWRLSLGTDEELRSLATQLAGSNLELIVALGTPHARAALRATTLPVVFGAGDPVANGLAASLAKPGGNGTGVSAVTTDLTPKRVEFLKQVAPGIRRIAYLENPSNPTRARLLQEARIAAKALGVEIEPVDARDIRELDTALRAIQRKGADAILVTADLLFLSNQAKVVRAVRETRLPALFPWREYHDEGVLMSYGSSLRDQARRMAAYVDKILKAAKPSDLPIEQVSKYELVIDLRVAGELGIKVPQDLLLRADEVIR
jgi:putative ABC transport system substrate-binding protein